MAGPPVAKMSLVCGALMSSRHPSMEGMLRQPMIPLGAPAFSAASATSFAARRVQARALGWGENTMPFPAFRAIMAL